jgi:hypothetical protein
LYFKTRIKLNQFNFVKDDKNDDKENFAATDEHLEHIDDREHDDTLKDQGDDDTLKDQGDDDTLKDQGDDDTLKDQNDANEFDISVSPRAKRVRTKRGSNKRFDNTVTINTDFEGRMIYYILGILGY